MAKKTKYKCFRCGSPIYTSDIEGYAYQCFNCDEDFYKIEIETPKTFRKIMFDRRQHNGIIID